MLPAVPHTPLARTALAVVCIALLGSPAGAAQRSGQRPQFTTAVEIVQLQVGVADADGQFVRGLGPDDFVVLVNGQERPVQVAYEVDLRQPGDGAVVVDDEPPRRSLAETAPVAARRHFLFFFDLSFTSRRGILEARRAALAFVDEQVHPDDLLAVATGTRFGIELISPFTSNRTQALASLSTLGLQSATDLIARGSGSEESISQALAELATGPGGDAGALSLLEAMEFREYVATVSNYTEQMAAFGRMLQGIEGRKHVVFFSRGFDDGVLTGQGAGALAQSAGERARGEISGYTGDSEMQFGSGEIRENMDELVEMLRGADAVIHAVDPTGLRVAGSGLGSSSPFGNPGSGADIGAAENNTGRQALVALSAGTGGTASWNMNDLTVALTQIEEQTSTFYLIGYRKGPDDPATVDLEVQVVRPGVSVTSAPSRLTPPPGFREMSEAQRQLQLAEHMNDDVDRSDIRFDAQVVAFPGVTETARVALLLEIGGIELERLASERGDDQIELELGGFAVAADDTVIDSFRRKVTIDVPTMRERGDLREQTFRYTDYVDTPPGEHRLRLLVREAEIGRLSSTTRRFWAPEPAESLTMSRPLIISNSSAPPLPADEAEFDPLAFDDRRFVPKAAPEAAPGEAFTMLVIAYHLPRDPETDEIAAGFVVEIEEDMQDGVAYRVRDAEILGTTYDPGSGITRMLVRVTVPALVRPGAARLWARIIDQVTGARVEEQTPLYVLGA